MRIVLAVLVLLVTMPVARADDLCPPREPILQDVCDHLRHMTASLAAIRAGDVAEGLVEIDAAGRAMVRYAHVLQAINDKIQEARQR